MSRFPIAEMCEKSLEWEYEREVRVARCFSDCQFSRLSSDFPIFVMDVPPECIRRVILGERVNQDIAMGIFRVIEDTSIMGDRAVANHWDYNLELMQFKLGPYKSGFIFSGGGKVTFKTQNIEYSANSIAEGFRKVGMLYRLLKTGAIQPGSSGPLFWDEPESNLNPKIMKLLVQILLELSRNGQQIIIATHDYVLLKWFDLLSEEGKEDHVRYHSLYRDTSTGEIELFSTDDYLRVAPNPIDEAFGYLIDKEIENSMGSLGK